MQPLRGLPFCNNLSLRYYIVEAPILAYPSSKQEDKYILDTDASLVGISGVLSQIQNGVERVIAFGSQSLSKAQQNYCTTYRELLAVVVFTRNYRHYLLGQPNFTIRTDHSSLRWLMNFKDPEGMISRWLVSMQPYNYTIEHRAGILHGNADGLSRQQPTKPRNRCKRVDCNDCHLTINQETNNIDDKVEKCSYNVNNIQEVNDNLSHQKVHNNSLHSFNISKLDSHLLESYNIREFELHEVDIDPIIMDNHSIIQDDSDLNEMDKNPIIMNHTERDH